MTEKYCKLVLKVSIIDGCNSCWLPGALAEPFANTKAFQIISKMRHLHNMNEQTDLFVLVVLLRIYSESPFWEEPQTKTSLGFPSIL